MATTGCEPSTGRFAPRRTPFAPTLKDLKRQAREAANSLQWWFRDRYRLPPNDPRFLALTSDELALDYWTAYYAASAAKGENISFEDEDDDYDLAAIESELEAQADQSALHDENPDAWEDVL